MGSGSGQSGDGGALDQAKVSSSDAKEVPMIQSILTDVYTMYILIT